MSYQRQTVRPPSSRISQVALRPPRSAIEGYIAVAKISRAEAAALGRLDASALFMFGFIDDRTSVLELLASSGLPVSEATDALVALCDAGAVALAEATR